MGVIENINKHKQASVAVAFGMVLAGLAVVYKSLGEANGISSLTQVYFSADDGKTFFADDSKKVAPFERNGKEVLGAKVFRGPDGSSFVGYLECAASAEAKARIEKIQSDMFAAAAAAAKTGVMPDPRKQDEINANLVVKKPGETEWVKANSPKARRVLLVTDKDGKLLDPVWP